jgi:hypothetical protein
MSREADTRLDKFGFPAFPAGARREIYIPSAFGEPPLKRSKLAQALIDIACVFVGLLLLCATAASIPVSLFLLFFCSF